MVTREIDGPPFITDLSRPPHRPHDGPSGISKGKEHQVSGHIDPAPTAW